MEEGGADVIHVDVMDGHFVPNISHRDPGGRVLAQGNPAAPRRASDDRSSGGYIDEFVRAGANRVLVHQEATVHLDRALAMIREAGAEAGAAINPATPVAMLTDVLDKVDTVLVMSVNPGLRGAEIHPQCVRENPAAESVALTL